MSIKYALERNHDNSLQKEILANTYVDNLLIGAVNNEEGIAKQHQCKEIFCNMRMNLREFVSNSKSVMNNIPDQGRTTWTSEYGQTAWHSMEPRFRQINGSYKNVKRSINKTNNSKDISLYF